MGYVLDLRQKLGQQPLIVAGAAAIVQQDQQLLLVERTDNHLWGLPAGSKELNEDLATTARRELREETGLDGVQPQLLTVVSGANMQYTYPNGDQIDSVTAVYALQVTGQALPDHDETSATDWFELDDLPTRLTPLTREILTRLKLN